MANPSIVIPPREKDLGAGFTVKRVLPWVKRKTVGPFVFWDHMGPSFLKNGDELQVRAHPHIGLSTLTYLFSGSIRHRDTLGITQDIKPGEVNWMTAGRGIAHSERTHPEMGTNITLHGIQVWIALPKDFEDVSPSFTHIPNQEIPKLELDGHQISLIAGSMFNLSSPVPVHSELFYLDILPKANTPIKLQIPKQSEAALYVAVGVVQVEDESYSTGEMIVWDNATEVSFTASDDARLLFFGGKPFSEKRHIWWNLVSSNPDKIEQAKKDWKNGKFGTVIDETEFIPLPED